MNYIIIDEKAIFGRNYCFGWWKSCLQKIFSDVEFTFFSTIMYKSHSILNFIQFFYIFFILIKQGTSIFIYYVSRVLSPLTMKKTLMKTPMMTQWILGVSSSNLLRQDIFFLNCACEELMYLIIYNIAQIKLVIITCNIVT